MEAVTLYGERVRFAAEVGRRWEKNPGLRRVDLWAANRHLTCDDNTVFVPQFIRSVEASIAAIHAGTVVRPQFSDDDMRRRALVAPDGPSFPSFPSFPSWGPTTDNISGALARTNHADRLEFAFRYNRETHPIKAERGAVFFVELATEELVGVLTQVIGLLRRDAPLSPAT